MPSARVNFAAVAVDGLVYALGGNSHQSLPVEVYDPRSDTWTRRSSYYSTEHFAAAAVDGIIYCFGGLAGTYISAVYAYNTKNDSWVEKASMPIGRAGLAAVALDGIIYVVGGCGCRSPCPVYAYDPQANSWTVLAVMPYSSIDISAAEIDGIIYVIGGRRQMRESDTCVTTGAVQAYNPKTNSWVVKANMPTRRTELTSTAVDGVIYSIGGSTLYWKDGEIFNVMEAFEVKSYTTCM